MKKQYPKKSIGCFSELFGYSRQAWYKSRKSRTKRHIRDRLVIKAVEDIRIDQKNIGTIKLQVKLNNDSNLGFKVGRDYLNNLLRNNGLLIKQRKRYRPEMTDGNGVSIYSDLRKDLQLNGPNQLWSSDITYVKLNNKHCYATFIVDEWSHLIVGYHVSRRMTALEVVKALQNAVIAQGPEFGGRLVHHSDRGSQYKSKIYQEMLKKHGIKPSMTENGSPYENPVAERLNGIIKNELLDGDTFNSFGQAATRIAKAVRIYNEERPHFSCGLMTPQKAHKSVGPLKNMWRKQNKKSSPNAVKPV